jgi:hypothetical protein
LADPTEQKQHVKGKRLSIRLSTHCVAPVTVLLIEIKGFTS